MSTQTIVNWLTKVFSDPEAAQNYANDPAQATQRELGDVDLNAVDIGQAVADACQGANIHPDAAEAIMNSIYQPAQTLRVPSERLALDNDGYPERCDYSALVNNDDDKGGEQTTLKEPCMVGPEQDAPPRMVDGDYGGKCVQPKDLTPETYYPENYEPTKPLTEDCVEYTVSNCVVVCHGDIPEVAETLCEERRYVDPYPREDPSHVCPTDTGGHCMPEWIPCDDLPEYDSDGYDQWGCDDQGYDREGYDPLGCDRDGNPRPYESSEDSDREPTEDYGDDPMTDREPTEDYGDDPMTDREPTEDYGDDPMTDREPTEDYGDDPMTDREPTKNYDATVGVYGRNGEPSKNDDDPMTDREPSKNYDDDPMTDRETAEDYGDGETTGREPTEDYGDGDKKEPEQTYEPDPEQTYEPDPEQTYEPDPEQTYEPDSEQAYEPDPEQEYQPDPTTNNYEDDVMDD